VTQEQGPSDPTASEGASARVPRLLELVRSRLSDERATVVPWKAGADFNAYLVRSRDREYVLRVPHREVVETRYDGTVDFARVIAREVEAHRLLQATGIPLAS
jgi:aminoglycoside phosphotransferase (APT) family kinase protein